MGFGDLFEKVVDEQYSEPFRSKVKLIIFHVFDIVFEGETTITWTCDIEYRSWGIKDIILKVDPITVDYTDEDSKSRKLEIKPEDIHIVRERGSGCYPQELRIWLKKDYSLWKAELQFVRF